MEEILACFNKKRNSNTLLNFLNYDRPLSVNFKHIGALKNEKVLQLLQVCVQMKQEYATKCTETHRTSELFDLCNEQLKLLNRIAEGETRWIASPLYTSALQLLHVSELLDKAEAEQETANARKKKVKGDLEDEKYLEKCVRTIHTSFKLCLNDRNPDFKDNKKWGVYHFTNLEFRIYHRLQNRDMVRNLVKVLDSRVSELPSPETALRACKAQLVTYYYYKGEFYGCHNGDFQKAFEFLNKAWLESCADVDVGAQQKDAIMVLLVPFAILAFKWYPDSVLLKQLHPRVAVLYAPLLACLQNGDLKALDTWLDAHELLLLRKNLYVATVLMRELVLVKLVKTCWRVNGARSIVPVDLVATAVTRSATHAAVGALTNDSLDETECLLANLICKGYIKGYLSHGNRAMVVSKTNAFPRQAADGNQQSTAT